MLITIGAFDGFHRGHAELFRLCREKAGGDDWAVVSFFPHPSEYMHRLTHTLFTLRERELLRRVLDIPKMYVLEFNDALRNLSPSEFWQKLRARFCVDGLVMGRDFHFGVNRGGSAEYLCALAKSDGLNNIHIADLLDKPRLSSSNVRENILAGSVESAREILGYPCFMMSKILHGSERGRTMSFPTANLDITNRIIPAEGVYSAAVLVDGKWHCGAASIGSNPTFHDIHETRLEIHILGFSGDIYGEELPVSILGRVRDMHTFPDKSELAHQIERDILTCTEIFESAMNVDETRRFLERAREILTRTSQNLNPEIIRLV